MQSSNDKLHCIPPQTIGHKKKDKIRLSTQEDTFNTELHEQAIEHHWQRYL